MQEWGMTIKKSRKLSLYKTVKQNLFMKNIHLGYKLRNLGLPFAVYNVPVLAIPYQWKQESISTSSKKTGNVNYVTKHF